MGKLVILGWVWMKFSLGCKLNVLMEFQGLDFAIFSGVAKMKEKLGGKKEWMESKEDDPTNSLTHSTLHRGFGSYTNLMQLDWCMRICLIVGSFKTSLAILFLGFFREEERKSEYH